MLPALDVKVIKTGFWHMPKTFYAILATTFWERFAFYALQSIIIVYLTKKFGSALSTNVLFGSFQSLMYTLLVVGGVIGDKLLGLRRTYVLGILFLLSGYSVLLLSLSISGLYLGFGLVLVGNILFKTNAINYVGRCFESNDPRLDIAFTYYYMWINLGSLTGLLIVPMVFRLYGYLIGSLPTVIAMIIAMGVYFIFISQFKYSDNQIGKNNKNTWFKIIVVAIGSFIAAVLFSLLLRNEALGKIILYATVIVILIIYLYTASRLNHYESRGMYIALLLMLQAGIFFILHIQLAILMKQFALQYVKLSFLGYIIPIGAMQNLNSLWVIILAPILAGIYVWRYKTYGQDFSIAGKLAGGLIINGLCFLFLALAAEFFANQNLQISFIWLVLGYGLFSVSELLVLALGPSMMIGLLPKRLGGFAGGMWFLAVMVGFQIGHKLLIFTVANSTSTISSREVFSAYMNLFYSMGAIAILIGIGLMFTLKAINRTIWYVRQHRI